VVEAPTGLVDEGAELISLCTLELIEAVIVAELDPVVHGELDPVVVADVPALVHSKLNLEYMAHGWQS
jgi:hypothetical protein